MNIWDAALLGIVQGISEFLPISSSGHLIFTEEFLGLKVENLLSFDIVMHLGSLLAILVYFRHDLAKMVRAFFLFVRGKIGRDDPYVKLIFYLIIGTIPIIIIAPLLADSLNTDLRNMRIVAMLMLLTGVLFLASEFAMKKKGEDVSKKLTWGKAVVIGFFQAMAITPGISRSGSTILAGLIVGLKREEAARFSFLLGILAVTGAAVYSFLPMMNGAGAEAVAETVVGIWPLIVGFLTSALVGYFTVAFLMHFLKHHSLVWFGVYLIIVGGLGVI